ncbi:Outer membrane receptor proteins, mostly Fe transport [Pustulibacterium marinum]|uniref:Outer membrane receptor proteins, mostly Fe transport n=1 Tax=Pustulibacterium marinum TaxID=1224947 RepID=A0A1I7ETC8_9FLAO|nr:outer membrane beta-barrel family protein [Pustulibacterium marinum]SFU27149.1 Outer membrane receptor proteins, mostly Fe transport [Pustulibacterium marinum]
MKYIFFLFAFCISLSSIAQTAVVKGKVLDKATSQPIPYAEITLKSVAVQDSVLLGGISNESGVFQLEKVPFGSYTVQATFMGFSKVEIPVTVDKYVVTVADILLKENVENLDEVVVKSNKPAIQYKVDRQVINAESFPTASVAVDLLQNVPSLQVDINGNITYRGDGTFVVYINGHRDPNGTEKLRQIPADQIERIEIITNPSSKYRSEGSAGIIQVILKKTRLEGYAINTEITTNTFGTLNGYASIDKKTARSGWYMNVQEGDQVFNKSEYNLQQRVLNNDVLYTTSLYRDQKYGQKVSYIQAGFNYDITPSDYIDFSANINYVNNRGYRDFTGNVTNEAYDAEGNILDQSYYNLQTTYRNNYGYYGGTFGYNHFFNESKSHKLVLNVDVSNYTSPYKESTIDSKIYEDRVEKIGYLNYEKNELLVNGTLDYTVPFSEETSLDVGVAVEIDNIPEVGNDNGNFDENNNLIPFSDERTNQIIDFKRNIYATYFNFKSKFKKLEYQFGLRLENTDTKSNYSYVAVDQQQVYIPASDNFTKLFPTAYLLYNFSDDIQLVANYTRRINRPGYYQLIPVLQYTDVTSYYLGNANIKPAYVDSYELGYKQNWTNKDYASFQFYHRKTTNVMQDYTVTGADEILISMPTNVGISQNTGVELMGNIAFKKWWTSNLSISLYDYHLEVDFDETAYTRNQFNYGAKWNNTFEVSDDFSIQYYMSYSGPFQGAQEKRDGFFYASLGVKKTFFDDRWKVNLTGSNIFDTQQYDVVTQGTDFSRISNYRNIPYLTLKIGYTFDNQE